jgi:hypothetical protein
LFSEGLDLGRREGISVGLGGVVVFQLFDLNMRAEGADQVLHFNLGSCARVNSRSPRSLHAECA